jgi:hypothetical protein
MQVLLPSLGTFLFLFNGGIGRADNAQPNTNNPIAS